MKFIAGKKNGHNIRNPVTVSLMLSHRATDPNQMLECQSDSVSSMHAM